MKKLNFVGTVIISLSMLAATGCHHKPATVIPIPDYQQGGSGNTGNTTPGGNTIPDNTQPTANPDGIPETGNGRYASLFEGAHNEDRDTFRDQTVFFDFDSATIRSSEESKLAAIADHFKNDTKMEALIIEGNCDERGTEKYNLSLGERRALAAREYLVNLGVDANRIKTVTYGASHPVEQGHDESAWKKNRRDEFVLVTPK